MQAPNDVHWHVREAVITARADRIGHGVSLTHEEKPNEVLRHMRKQRVGVEILLASNERLLGVKANKNAFELYRDKRVPWVLASDDPGILRSSLNGAWNLNVGELLLVSSIVAA